MIETRLLYYFLAIAREQNITKAAEVLHITQPSLSKQMQDLENIVGRKLLIRGNKNTTLTEDGAYFRSKAEEIIDLLEKTESSFDETISLGGHLSLGCAETSKMTILCNIMKDISKDNPKLQFDIYSGNANDVLEKIDKGLLDIGLLFKPDFIERYDYIETPFEDSFGLLVNCESSLASKKFISVSDLNNIPLLISSQRTNFEAMESFMSKIKPLNIIGSYNLIYNASLMVEEGLGNAICFSNLVNTEKRKLTYIPFDPEIKGKLYLVTKKYQNKSSALKLFITKVQELFSKLNNNFT